MLKKRQVIEKKEKIQVLEKMSTSNLCFLIMMKVASLKKDKIWLALMSPSHTCIFTLSCLKKLAMAHHA